MLEIIDAISDAILIRLVISIALELNFGFFEISVF